MSDPPSIGPTGAFPEGHYTEEDQGEIEIAIAADPRNRKVLILFGTKISWLGISPDEAESLGLFLVQKAKEARGETL